MVEEYCKLFYLLQKFCKKQYGFLLTLEEINFVLENISEERVYTEVIEYFFGTIISDTHESLDSYVVQGTITENFFSRREIKSLNAQLKILERKNKKESQLSVTSEPKLSDGELIAAFQKEDSDTKKPSGKKSDRKKKKRRHKRRKDQSQKTLESKVERPEDIISHGLGEDTDASFETSEDSSPTSVATTSFSQGRTSPLELELTHDLSPLPYKKVPGPRVDQETLDLWRGQFESLKLLIQRQYKTDRTKKILEARRSLSQQPY